MAALRASCCAPPPLTLSQREREHPVASTTPREDRSAPGTDISACTIPCETL